MKKISGDYEQLSVLNEPLQMKNKPRRLVNNVLVINCQESQSDLEDRPKNDIDSFILNSSLFNNSKADSVKVKKDNDDSQIGKGW